MAGLSTPELRDRFVLEDLFAPGRGALGAHAPRPDPHRRRDARRWQRSSSSAPHEIRATAFCDRREIGIVCLSGSGVVVADGEELTLDAEDIAYVGQGTTSRVGRR